MSDIYGFEEGDILFDNSGVGPCWGIFVEEISEDDNDEESYIEIYCVWGETMYKAIENYKKNPHNTDCTDSPEDLEKRGSIDKLNWREITQC